MFHPTSPEIEKLFYATFGNGQRVACVTGFAACAGVSTLADCLARRAALTEQRTLLLNLSEDMIEGNNAIGDGAPHATDRMAPAGRNSLDFDRLTLQVNSDALFYYRDKSKLRAYIDDHLNHYDLIVVDAAPCRDLEAKALSGVISAAASDCVVVVALGGSTSDADIKGAMAALAAVNAAVVGLIVNNRDNPRLSTDMARAARRLNRFFPALSRRLETFARSSPLLQGAD